MVRLENDDWKKEDLTMNVCLKINPKKRGTTPIEDIVHN